MPQVPIIKLGEVLLVSIQYDLDDKSILKLQEDIASEIVKTKATGLLIDISSLDLLDSYFCRKLSDMSRMALLMNTNTVVVGFRPEVAISIVEMGIEMENIKTALNTEAGLEILKKNPRK